MMALRQRSPETIPADARSAAQRTTALRQFAFVMALLVLFWIAVVAIIIGTFSLRAWDDRHDGVAAIASASPPPVPTMPADSQHAGVPAAAQMVERDIVLGDDPDALYFFRDSTCVDDVLTIAMSRAVVFAETPCDRAVSPASVPRVIGHPVTLRVVGTELVLQDFFIGSFRFDVRRVWLLAR